MLCSLLLCVGIIACIAFTRGLVLLVFGSKAVDVVHTLADLPCFELLLTPWVYFVLFHKKINCGGGENSAESSSKH